MNLLKCKSTLIITALFFSLLSLKVSAQENNPPLSMRSGVWSYSFYIGSRQVSQGEFKKTLQVNPEAYRMYKSGKALDITGIIIGSAGAFTFGYDLGGRCAGAGGNNIALIGGGAAMLGGMAMSIVGAKKRLKALQIYNLKNAGFVDVSVNGTGAALVWTF